MEFKVGDLVEALVGCVCGEDDCVVKGRCYVVTEVEGTGVYVKPTNTNRLHDARDFALFDEVHKD